MTWYYILAGLFSGIIGGMGMGGGTVLIPILTLLLGTAQHTAQATNLIAFLPMAIFSIAVHVRHKLIDYKKGLFMILGGTVFSFIGAALATGISKALLRRLFGIFIILVGIFQIVMILILRRKKKKQSGK